MDIRIHKGIDRALCRAPVFEAEFRCRVPARHALAERVP
jgi:hypothetical protein